MCVGLPPSPEELEKMARANRKYDEMFRAEHPFLSLFNNLLLCFICGWLFFFSGYALWFTGCSFARKDEHLFFTCL